MRWIVVSVIGIATACAPKEPHADSSVAQRPAAVCTPPANGIVVGEDTIGPFPITATLAELVRICPAGDTTLYDAVGFQAMARVFPFVGARITAAQPDHPFGDWIDSTKPADLWIITGDSVRLPDGQLLPRTLGEMRARYGRLVVSDNFAGSDDDDGPGARMCRFPHVYFGLAIDDTARKVADSARVVRIEVTRSDGKTIERFCRQTTP
jgi:hypothetical protein